MEARRSRAAIGEKKRRPQEARGKSAGWEWLKKFRLGGAVDTVYSGSWEEEDRMSLVLVKKVGPCKVVRDCCSGPEGAGKKEERTRGYQVGI